MRMEVVATITPGIMKVMKNCDVLKGLDFADLPMADI
jgi:hypothetical protein